MYSSDLSNLTPTAAPTMSLASKWPRPKNKKSATPIMADLFSVSLRLFIGFTLIMNKKNPIEPVAQQIQAAISDLGLFGLAVILISGSLHKARQGIVSLPAHELSAFFMIQSFVVWSIGQYGDNIKSVANDPKQLAVLVFSFIVLSGILSLSGKR